MSGVRCFAFRRARRVDVNLRYPRQMRDSLEKLRQLPIVTHSGATIPLSEIADINITASPDMIRSENARLSEWVYINLADRDLGSYVKQAQQVINKHLNLPPGYSLSWSGQYEYLERAKERLLLVVPITLSIIVLLLFLNFRRFGELIIILTTLPLSLVGGVWLLYLLGYHLSVAVGVGFIALAGIAIEIGVVKLVYLNQALAKQQHLAQVAKHSLTINDIHKAIVEGALLRLRPISMTVSAIICGLLPIMLFDGTGSEFMRRIAAPMLGGIISTALLTLIVIPAVYLIWKRHELLKE